MAKFVFKAIHEVEADNLEDALQKFSEREVEPEWMEEEHHKAVNDGIKYCETFSCSLPIISMGGKTDDLL